MDINPQITIDDGADLISLIHGKRKALLKTVWAGQEETTTGVIRLKAMAKANKLSVEDGALVVREALGEHPVIKGSAADRAGIKEFDILVECNGEKITTQNPLMQALQKCKIGEETVFKVLRDGKELILKAVLSEKE